ncbi:MAG: DUF1857 family protein [Burkholderiales bacterium]|nr:DUF1857 family protein [Burkholderiales bacterium]
MRFEHVIEINSPRATLAVATPPFTREQLWRGLLIRVQTPQRFPMGPDSCVWRQTEPDVYARTLKFGAQVFTDEVVITPLQCLEFTPEKHDETTPIKLTIRIEAPQSGQMVLRFVYESVSELSPEEAYFSEYRHNAWLHHDRDMVRTLRQWLTDGDL